MNSCSLSEVPADSLGGPGRAASGHKSGGVIVHALPFRSSRFGSTEVKATRLRGETQMLRARVGTGQVGHDSEPFLF